MNKICLGRIPETGEVLEWILPETMKESKGHIHLWCLKGICVIPFVDLNKKHDIKTFFYENSDLKQWLYDSFLYTYFSEEERRCISSVRIPSVVEIEKYFPEKEKRICFPTEFAKEKGAAIFKSYNGSDACVYWLSDTGRREGMSTAVVMGDGGIYKSAYLAATNVCVRPILELADKEGVKWG